MEHYESFVYINSTYWNVFHHSYLNVFLDEHPVGNTFTWKLKRFILYFIIYIYFPFWILLQGTGIIFGPPADFVQIGFEVSHFTHIVELQFKLTYFIHFIEEMRKLCCKFEQFNSSNHRPIFARKLLTKSSNAVRKLSNNYYILIYINLFGWCVIPFISQPLLYGLSKIGIIEKKVDSFIPIFLECRYAFDKSSNSIHILTSSLEFFILLWGFTYYISVDQFFISVIMMVHGQIEMICKSIQSQKELMLGTKIIPDDISFHSLDSKGPIDIKLFIEDHQKALSITRKIRILMDPIIAAVSAGIMIVLLTLSMDMTKIVKEATSITYAIKEFSNLFVVIAIVTLKFFLYARMSGEIKAAEETVFHAVYSSNWLEEQVDYRRAVVLVMKQSMKARKVKMLGMGDMDRETFIQGLRAVYSFYNFLVNK